MDRAVREYYDANTRVFLRTELQKNRRSAIHRALRLPETDALGGDTVTDPVHLLLRDALRRYVGSDLAKTRLLDLGCGVGGTLEWLSRTEGGTLSGITLSGVQAQAARGRLGERATITAGSFTDPGTLRAACAGERVDAAYMIESFVHGEDAAALFRHLGAVVRPGGVLVIIDDLPSPRASSLAADSAGNRRDQRKQTLIAEFRSGWHVNTYIPADSLASIAGEWGWRWVEERDLSSWVRTDRVRDHAARAASRILRCLRLNGSYWENLVGGGALQRLVRLGLNRYELLVFRREESVSVQ